MKLIKTISTLLTLIAFSFQLAAQVPRDSSYTIQSAYKKIKVKYPNISIPTADGKLQVITQNDLTYKRIGNREIKADIYYPTKPNTKRNGLVLVHGGGWRTGDKSMMKSIAEKLADKGYWVCVPEYRMSLEAPYPAAVYDLKDAIKWFKSRDYDLEKVAIIGFSAGGQLASLVGTTNGITHFETFTETPYNADVQAIIDVDGVLAFKHPVSKEGTMAAQWLGGTYEEKSSTWEEASALSHVNQTTPPTLFIASKHPRFLAGHLAYMEALNKHGILIKKVEMGDAPHSFWLFHPWHNATITHICNFLDKVF
ncbi:alpha/beta hydrolase [Limibacter armeniacum]|uniref:alpha/beta hydrolase n=1 Tax=Limibacter armeniacum TaxID=466084 RepID=UPI002FE65021